MPRAVRIDRPRPKPAAFLGSAAVRRLCIDLIASEQDRLIRERRLSARQHIARVLDGGRDLRVSVEIGEEDLGLDSLARLDVVGAVCRFFCLDDSGTEDLLLVHRDLDDWVRIVDAHIERLGDGIRIGFETSGSTGTPKRVLHDARDLDAEVAEVLRTVVVGPSPLARVLSAVPPRHIYGFLWSVLLPERAGVEVLELHRSTGAALFRHCRPGDLVIGTPFTWERAAQSGGRVPSGITGVTSAAPSTAATWGGARRMGLDRLVEVYGSTETGGIGWREAPDLPFQLSDRVERCGQALRRRSCGTRLALQDRLEWRGQDRFVVAGRLDDVVQVAGTNVSTAKVAEVLGTVSGVAEVAVRLDGSRLRALVVPEAPDGPIDMLEDSLRALAMTALDPPARPDRYQFAPALPRTPIGKLADW